MTAEGGNQQPQKKITKVDSIAGAEAESDKTPVGKKKSGKKKKPRQIVKETDPESEAETSEAFKSSSEFSTNGTKKARVIGKRKPSARPKAGHFIPNQHILDEPFPESPGSLNAKLRNLSPQRKELNKLNIGNNQGVKPTAQARKGRGRTRSISPSRKDSHVSVASEGNASSAKQKKSNSSRSHSSSPVRKASNVSTSSDGALSDYLKRRESHRSLSPSRKASNVSSASEGSGELWTLPRRKSSTRSSQSLSPARKRRPLEKVIEENESAGVSTILRNKQKAIARSQSSSPVRKPKSVSKAVKVGELSPLSGVLKRKSNEIRTSQTLSPIREAKTVSKALKGEQSSKITNILKKKKTKSQLARSRSSSPVRKGRATSRDDDESLSSHKRTIRKPARSLSPVRENSDSSQVVGDKAPVSPGSLSLKLRKKRAQLKQSLSPIRKNMNSVRSQGNEGDGASQVSKKSNGVKSHSLSPKSNKSILDDPSIKKKRVTSLSPKGGTESRRSAMEHQGSARIDFTGAVIDMDDGNPSEHSQLTMQSSIHHDVHEYKSKNRKQSMQTINSNADSDDDEDPEQHASTLSFAVEHPESVLSFADKPLDSQFTVFDTSDLGSALEDHIRKSRTRDTDNSTPSLEDDGSEVAKPSFKHLHPASVKKPFSDRDNGILAHSNRTDFPEDTKLQKFLRYLYILPPNRNETPREWRIRVLTWTSLICDFLAAIVAVTTFRDVNQCCGVPILSTLVFKAEWSLVIGATVIVYISMIFMEVVPVVRHQLPFNLINPTLGFLITFAVFFDDDIAEAVFMWVIEVIAIICEILVYRLKRTTYLEKETLIMDTEDDIKRIKEQMRDRRRRMKKLREISNSPGTHKGRVVKKLSGENGGYPEPPTSSRGPKSLNSMGFDSSSRAAPSSRSPLRKYSNSPKSNASGASMRDRSRSISLGSRSADGSLSPVRTFSNSSKRVSSRSPLRERLETESVGSRGASLSPVRESFHPRRRQADMSPVRRGPTSEPFVHENGSAASSRSQVRRASYRVQRTPSLSPVRRGSSGAFSNRSTGSSPLRSQPSPGNSGRAGPRVGRSPVRRQFSSSDMMHPSSDSLRVPMGNDENYPSSTFSMTLEEEELETQRKKQRSDDQQEMTKMIHVRRWKQEQEVALSNLGYLLVGVVYNTFLVLFTMIFIIMIAKNEGLCISDEKAPAIFDSGQLDLCHECIGEDLTDGHCEVCRDDMNQCYWGYY